MNLDTGAAVNTFPLNFGPEGARVGRFYRTASGQWILDGGAWQFQRYDEKRIAQISEWKTTKVLCSAAEIACKGRQMTTSDMMIPIHSKSGQGLRIHFEKLMNWYGKNEQFLST